MQQFDITVPVVGSFVVHAAGRYIKYMSGSNGGGDASLFLTPGAQGGSKIRLQPGFAYRVADDLGMPDSWTLQNAAGSAPIIGQVVIGNGKIDDSTVQGVVQMVDGGKVRSLAGNAFMAYGGPGPVAAQYGRVQLWNPASNPNRLIVESMTMLANGANQAAGFVIGLPQLATLTVLGMSKKSGGPASVAGIYTDTTAASVTAGQLMNSLAAVSSTSVTFTPKEPIVIMPGSSLTLYSVVLNALLGCTYEWYEEANV